MEVKTLAIPEELSRFKRKYRNANFIVRYGSNRPGRDIDLFVVVPDRYQAPRYHYPEGTLDPLVIRFSEFRGRIAHLDPVVTEPMLTGTVLQGNVKFYDAIRHALSGVTVTPDIVRYLRRCAQFTVESVIDILENDNGGRIQRLTALCNVTFALSYALFASYYQQRPRSAVSLCELIEYNWNQSENLREATEYFRKAKHAVIPPDPKKILFFLLQAQAMISALLSFEDEIVPETS